MPPIAALFPGYKRREEMVSPLLLQSGNKATSVDPIVDTEQESTPEDLDPAVAQKAGRKAENDADLLRDWMVKKYILHGI